MASSAKFETKAFKRSITEPEFKEVTVTKIDSKLPQYKLGNKNYVWNGLRNVLKIIYPGSDVDMLIFKENLVEAFDNVYIKEEI